MGAFLENSMFLFMDDSEPILPIFRSTEYGNAGRVVELADVGCDTETTFPIHFPHGAFDRRRGGAESLRSTRRITKWLHERPNSFTRRVSDLNNNDDRNGNYIRGKMRQNVCNYDEEPDANFNNSYTENSYDLELSKNNLAVEEDNYIQFVNPQNAIARSRRERVSRYDYSRDLEPPFKQSIHVPLRKNISPQWLAESDKKNLCEIHNTDIQSGERKKRTKILSRTNGSFNREAELEQPRDITMYREQDDLPNVVDPVAPSKQMFWDFISFENDLECEDTTFYNPTKTKHHGGLQKMAPRRRRSYIFNSQPKRTNVVDSDGEEFNETVKKNSRENLSPKNSINSERYRTSKGDMVKEKPKILRLNTPNANSLRGQSMKTSIDRQISNMYSTAKDSINIRPHSATEGKKNKFPTTERREDIANTTGTTVDDRRYRNKFVNKLSNNSPKKTGRLTRMFSRIADSSSNGRIEMENERDNTNSHRGNAGNNYL
ncbi:PREDICTED: uncharacterized protein LOC108778365 isoform X2 [Cyphomyrmex costatus]|uniref:uncharacterized protein LOC108778365 isoform X2 n=1 Tax=Cyphomyrmex costatus TaxID=456900 RepID=UPI0008522AA9|nr:PREDICTED: uncharacterized protein LOC108778365 isoform X2 [Cyphomyrmex costatus]